MNPRIPRQAKSRWFAAHATLALLAMAGAIGLQGLWKSPLPAGTESWRPYQAAILVSTTVWLIGTAWLHGSLTAGLAPRGQILFQCLADIATACAAAFLLAQGHSTGLALSGLWPICPLLIAIAAPSGLILLANAVSVEANGSCVSLSKVVAFRFASLAALLTCLVLVTLV